MRNLTAKCFFNESLLENFCALIERDLDEVCHCQRPNCLKSCRSLNFWQIADALDIISTPNYIFRKDEVRQNYCEKIFFTVNFRMFKFVIKNSGRSYVVFIENGESDGFKRRLGKFDEIFLR